MKFYFFSVLLAVVFYSKLNILASPPKGGIGDGYIYPVMQTASKPKTTTTYYAKPLHPPTMKKPPKPKPEIFKVIIENQDDVPKPNKHEQVFKIIHLPAKANTKSSGKSVKILKIYHIQQSKGGQKGGWSN